MVTNNTASNTHTFEWHSAFTVVEPRGETHGEPFDCLQTIWVFIADYRQSFAEWVFSECLGVCVCLLLFVVVETDIGSVFVCGGVSCAKRQFLYMCMTLKVGPKWWKGSKNVETARGVMQELVWKFIYGPVFHFIHASLMGPGCNMKWMLASWEQNQEQKVQIFC